METLTEDEIKAIEAQKDAEALALGGRISQGISGVERMKKAGVRALEHGFREFMSSRKEGARVWRRLIADIEVVRALLRIPGDQPIHKRYRNPLTNGVCGWGGIVGPGLLVNTAWRTYERQYKVFQHPELAAELLEDGGRTLTELEEIINRERRAAKAEAALPPEVE
jgi:hypothetical protein